MEILDLCLKSGNFKLKKWDFVLRKWKFSYCTGKLTFHCFSMPNKPIPYICCLAHWNSPLNSAIWLIMQIVPFFLFHDNSFGTAKILNCKFQFQGVEIQLSKSELVGHANLSYLCNLYLPSHPPIPTHTITTSPGSGDSHPPVVWMWERGKWSWCVIELDWK